MVYLQTILLLAFVAFAASKPAVQKYATSIDESTVDNVLKNKRLVQSYGKCLTSKGSCTPDGQELRTILPDLLETECASCSEQQKNSGEKVLDHLIKNEPGIWKEIEEAFDKDGKYKKRFCEISKERNKETYGQCA